MKRANNKKIKYSIEIDEQGYPIEEESPEEEPAEKPRKRKSILRKLMVRLIALCLVVLIIELGVLLWSGQIWWYITTGRRTELSFGTAAV